MSELGPLAGNGGGPPEKGEKGEEGRGGEEEGRERRGRKGRGRAISQRTKILATAL